jgi:RNA polymerase sigma-70 factor (ECF subfamily)
MVYCVVPWELGEKLHEPLRRHFADDTTVEVVVEQRGRERRKRPERRTAETPVETERRRVNAADGRRVAERRAPAMPVDAQWLLPRRALAHADRLTWLERVEPTAQRAEDVSTARLVARIQGGEDDLFPELYMRYFDRVYGYLRVAFRDHHEAEDATQNVFMKLHDAIGRYDRRRGPFRPWLFTIVRNQAIDELRRLKRIVPTDSAELDSQREGHRQDTDTDVDDLGALGWISDRDLLVFIERLPLQQRQVLMLRYMLELTPSEIGQLLGLTPEHVRKLQSRALEFLRARLTSLGRTATGRPARMMRARKIAPVLRGRRFALIDRL